MAKWGDTVLADVDSKHKVDFRLGTIINEKFVDIANVEVGRKATITKIKDDHVKLLLEAKTIIKRIVSQYHFIRPPSIKIYSLQVCGLKADLLETTLVSQSKSKYVTNRVCERIRLPMNETQTNQAKTFMQSIMLFRQEVQSMGRIVKMDVVNAVDRRSSFGRVFKPGFKDNLPNYSNWIEDEQA